MHDIVHNKLRLKRSFDPESVQFQPGFPRDGVNSKNNLLSCDLKFAVHNPLYNATKIQHYPSDEAHLAIPKENLTGRYLHYFQIYPIVQISFRPTTPTNRYLNLKLQPIAIFRKVARA